MDSDETQAPQAQERLVAILVPESMVAAAKDRFRELAAHPASLGRARRYSASCAIRAAVRVGLASLDLTKPDSEAR